MRTRNPKLGRHSHPRPLSRRGGEEEISSGILSPSSPALGKESAEKRESIFDERSHQVVVNKDSGFTNKAKQSQSWTGENLVKQRGNAAVSEPHRASGHVGVRRLRDDLLEAGLMPIMKGGVQGANRSAVITLLRNGLSKRSFRKRTIEGLSPLKVAHTW